MLASALSDQEKELLKLIQQASNRYDWVAYERLNRELAEYKYKETHALSNSRTRT